MNGGGECGENPNYDGGKKEIKKRHLQTYKMTFNHLGKKGERRGHTNPDDPVKPS